MFTIAVRYCHSRVFPHNDNDHFPVDNDTADLPNRRETSTSKKSDRDQTRWLDGLRGWAAFFVFLGHFSSVYWHETLYVYGTMFPKDHIIRDSIYVPYAVLDPEGLRVHDPTLLPNHNLFQLPVLRLLYYGDTMVATFFIVSGYSLSLKPLTLIRQGGRHADLLSAMSSSVFRRPMRLLLPVVVSSAIIAFLAGTGALSWSAHIEQGLGWAGFHDHFKGYQTCIGLPMFPTLPSQMKHWLISLGDLLDFFTHRRWATSPYDGHLWTIPVEFKCSLLLFLTHLATARLRPRVRMTLLATLTLLALTWGNMWEMAVFWAGMLLCEVNMVTAEEVSHHHHHHRNNNDFRTSFWKQPPMRAVVLIFGLYLASYPRYGARFSPLFRWASHRIPGPGPSGQWRLKECMGTVIAVAAISYTPSCKRFLAGRLSSYLGRISFALYLVHGTLLRAFNQPLTFALWKVVGRDTSLQYNMAVWIGFLFTIPLLFVLSHAFCVLIDEPIVRMTKKLEDRLTRSSPVRQDWEKVPEHDFDEEEDDDGDDDEVDDTREDSFRTSPSDRPRTHQLV